jgi:hypothetical protein
MEVSPCYNTVCSIVCPNDDGSAVCGCKALDASSIAGYFDINYDGYIDLTEFIDIYSAAVTGNWPYAADLIWNSCNLDNSDSLEPTEAFACYTSMCQTYCLSHPDIACQCNDHSAEDLMPIYDNDNNQ